MSKVIVNEREFEIAAEDIPRCPELDGSTLRIVPSYTEAGWYSEANVITVTDSERTALYIPLRTIGPGDPKYEDVEASASTS